MSEFQLGKYDVAASELLFRAESIFLGGKWMRGDL
jgi:hypothetical protein